MKRVGGFTLVELTTACVVVTIALLGVYVIFRDTVKTERRLTVGWQDRQAAEAIVSQICQAVQSAVEMPDIPAMRTGEEESDGSPFFECMTYGDSRQSTLQRRRYRWDTETGVIDVRTIVYSGSQPVSVVQQEGLDVWANVEPVLIGRRLAGLSIQFKAPADDEWQDQYTRSEFPTIVRVQATVGGSSVERIVSCPLTMGVLEGSR